MSSSECLFCREAGGEVLWQDDLCRVVWPGDPEHTGLCRVILTAHVREMTDLAPHQRSRVMMVVFELEQALKELLQPDKINLASLGNMVPHVHWHVIPRFIADPHFPGSVWSAKLRPDPVPVPSDFSARLRTRLERLSTS